jgi:hemerythrin-like metal-binding protein
VRDAGKDKEVMARLMLDVARYAQCHFAYEETLMLAYEYPEITQHVEHHQRILETLKNAMSAGMNISQARLQLIEWLSSHIPLDDRPMAQFILSRRPSVVTRVAPRPKGH